MLRIGDLAVLSMHARASYRSSLANSTTLELELDTSSCPEQALAGSKYTTLTADLDVDRFYPYVVQWAASLVRGIEKLPEVSQAHTVTTSDGVEFVQPRTNWKFA